MNTPSYGKRKTTLRWFTAGMILTAILSAVMSVTTARATPYRFNEKIEEALEGNWGKISFNIRWRFEYVDQEGKGIARGDPIRLRLGYLTPKIAGFQAFAEFEGNTPVFLNDYNSTRNNKTQYPVIADPAEAELNQGWLAYSGLPGTTIKAGRQKIIYNNHRFLPSSKDNNRLFTHWLSCWGRPPVKWISTRNPL